MINISPDLQKILSAGLTSGCEVTLDALIVAVGANGMALDQLNSVNNFLTQWGLELLPPLNEGDFLTTRRLRSTQRQHIRADQTRTELNRGEDSGREFKSSLLFDHKRAAASPHTPLRQLRSEDVLFSSLKSIAAFINSGGGVLFVGVGDDASAVGLHHDCSLLGCSEFDSDKWQLELRKEVTGKFKDGGVVNDYIEVSFIEIDGCHIARVQVMARQRLVFLKNGNAMQLYRRQGNRTFKVEIDELEDFLESRRVKSS